MGIYARLTATDETKMPVHAFGAAMRLWLTGEIAGTVAVERLELGSEEISEATAIKTKYDGLNNNAKAQFLTKVEDCFVLAEAELMSEAEAKTILGF